MGELAMGKENLEMSSYLCCYRYNIFAYYEDEKGNVDCSLKLHESLLNSIDALYSYKVV